MASTGPHDQETRARVLADLAAGVPVSEVSRRHGVSRPTIRAWRGEAGLTSLPLATAAREDLGALVVAQARETFLTLQAVVRRLREPEFLERQDAGTLVAIHRELSDGAVGWLEGLHPVDQQARLVPVDDDDEPPPAGAAGAPDAPA